MNRYNNYFNAAIQCLLVASVVFMTSSVQADDYDHSNGQWLIAKYDLNGDTMITRDEVKTKRQAIFRYMDADSDGGVSFKEYVTLDAIKRQALLKARYNKLDLDQDGRVTTAEYKAYKGLFASIDSDGDGALSATEIGSKAVAKKSPATHCLLWFCVRTKLKQ